MTSSASAPHASSSYTLDAAASSSTASALLSSASSALFASLLQPPRPRRAASSSADAASSAAHYTQRVAGRRLQLANPERSRPTAPAGSLAARKLARRDARVEREERRARERKRGRDKGKDRDKGQGPQEILSAARERTGRAQKSALSRRERKLLGLDAAQEQCSYESLLPIHALWRPYAQALLGLTELEGKPVPSVLSPTSVSDSSSGGGGSGGARQQGWHVNPQAMASMQANLIKAELAGCWATVSRSANPALVGLAGLVARETEGTFVIVSPPRPAPASGARGASDARKGRVDRGRTAVVPKRGTTFLISVPLPPLPPPAGSTSEADAAAQQPGAAVPVQTLDFPLHGQQMCYSLAARATRKFKGKRSIDV